MGLSPEAHRIRTCPLTCSPVTEMHIRPWEVLPGAHRPLPPFLWMTWQPWSLVCFSLLIPTLSFHVFLWPLSTFTFNPQTVACLHAWVLSPFSHGRLCDPVDCSPPGSSVHGILQARILEWVVVPSSRGSSQLKNRTQGLLHLLHHRQIL